jgi:hypothetical protein
MFARPQSSTGAESVLCVRWFEGLIRACSASDQTDHGAPPGSPAGHSITAITATSRHYQKRSSLSATAIFLHHKLCAHSVSADSAWDDPESTSVGPSYGNTIDSDGEGGPKGQMALNCSRELLVFIGSGIFRLL